MLGARTVDDAGRWSWSAVGHSFGRAARTAQRRSRTVHGMTPSDRIVASGLTPHADRNRSSWNADSDAYQERNGPQLAASGGMAWGVWQIPDAELRVRGDVRDRDMLELGCGAAQWSIALARAGARPVGH